MTYSAEKSEGRLPGREYQIALDQVVGVTRFYALETKIYVLVVLHRVRESSMAAEFFNSFKIKPGLGLDAQPLQIGRGIGAGQSTAGNSGDNETFSGRAVNQKARILSKPEPSYTESARKYGVQGTVVLRGVLSKDGDLTKVVILRRLPHGLTDQALEAAQRLRFSPAIKDGQPVSQYIQLEYNFNLY
jgi:TonB family protein